MGTIASYSIYCHQLNSVVMVVPVLQIGVHNVRLQTRDDGSKWKLKYKGIRELSQ